MLTGALWLVLAASAPASQDKPNVVLVTIDTLRADRVGAYGYEGTDTPTLDGLARDGVLLEDAVVQVPQTRPSHASIFTGRLPYEHGVRDNASSPLDPDLPTLPDQFRRLGYATAGFIGAYPLSRDSGLDRGFDDFDDPFSGQSTRRAEARSERRAEEVVDGALGWLQDAPRPFFVWVHVFDPHAPYDAPSPWRERYRAAAYDGEVAYADAQLGRLLMWLDDEGLRDSTLVVATSDHGEGLGDHGEDEHLFLIYDSTLSVPLLLRWPERLPAGARIRGQFRSVDLMPTVLELVGAPPVPTTGVSRARALQDGTAIPDNESYAESLYGQLHYGYAPLRALRAEGWKYIHAPQAELYHLGDDPGERSNRIDDRGYVAEAMRNRLLALDLRDLQPSSIAADSAAAERLASLGYVGGGFFTGTPSGADPKDKLAEFQAGRRVETQAIRLFLDGQYQQALELLEPLQRVRTDSEGRIVRPHSYNVSYYAGRSLLAMRRFVEAIGPLKEAVRLAPAMPITYVYLSSAQAGAGRIDDALATIRRALDASPRSAELHLARGRLLLQEGTLREAALALETSRILNPGDASTRAALADVERGRGNLEAALLEASAAVDLAPDWAGGHVAKGLVLGALGRERQAGAEFRRALELEPEHHDALYFLAAIERRAGRPEVALPFLERLVGLAPSYAGAQEALVAVRASSGELPGHGDLRVRLLKAPSRAMADAAVGRLRAGEDFAAVALDISSEDLGPVSVSDLAPFLRDTASLLSPGQVSDPIVLGGGFLVLLREE
jgi:arylsulfatase A-like enzyme/Flp pilus assembly protein TadD